MTTLTLKNPPTDIISRTLFADNNNLLVSSWDKTISLYNTDANTRTCSITTEAPVLDCAFYLVSFFNGYQAGNANLWTYGGLEKKVHYYDVTSGKDIVLGEHEAPIKAISVNTSNGLILSGSWDKTIKGWNINAPHDAFSATMSDKIYAMAITDNFIAVGTADKNVSVYDTRNLKEPFSVKSLGFSYHIRNVCWVQNNSGYAVSSSEGRVAVEFVTSAKKGFSFKCHRVNNAETNTTLVYPINALGVHPKYGTLATGGSDGSVCIWDIEQKKRISKLQLPCS